MGRGSSGAGGGKSGGGKIAVVLDKLDLGSESIDLSSSPLTYGDNDAALTGAARKSVEAFEDKRYKNKIEYSELIMDDGTVVESNKGGKGSVRSSIAARMKADVLTHNHPREDGILGGTFSDTDLSNFGKYHQTTYRATTKEGTYSISKGKNFNGKELVSAYKSFMNTNDRNLSHAMKKLRDNYIDGKLSRAEFMSANKSAFNKSLVKLHNWLSDNQANYGYTYTLERRSAK